MILKRLLFMHSEQNNFYHRDLTLCVDDSNRHEKHEADDPWNHFKWHEDDGAK